MPRTEGRVDGLLDDESHEVVVGVAVEALPQVVRQREPLEHLQRLRVEPARDKIETLSGWVVARGAGLSLDELLLRVRQQLG